MAQPDLAASLWRVVPEDARTAFGNGNERLTLTLLRRARDAQAPGSAGWAALERLTGLVLIHTLREVEGTFALERADAVLDAAGVPRPTLAWLEDGPGAEDAR